MPLFAIERLAMHSVPEDGFQAWTGCLLRVELGLIHSDVECTYDLCSTATYRAESSDQDVKNVGPAFP